MAIDPTAALAATATGSGTAAGKARLAENFDTFLSLLTTQLKNQDPLSPLDANQFTQQIVQMTGVEQQLLSNDLLQKLVANSSNGVSTAVGLIGKEVRAVTSDAALSGGKAEWVYKLASPAAEVKLEVLDKNGRVVSAEVATNAGTGDHTYRWDGKDGTGHALPDGTYTLRIAAKDGSDAAVGGSIFVDGLVTAVEQLDGKTLLTINGGKVPWETVNTVRLPSAAPPTNTAGQTPVPAPV